MGYGKDADSNFLKEMVKAFNTCDSIIKVEEEMCALYHHVENEESLQYAFTIFEKLFDFQKNVLEAKKDLLISFMKSKLNSLQNNKAQLEELEKQTASLTNHQINSARNVVKSLENVDESIEESIKKLKDLIKNLQIDL